MCSTVRVRIRTAHGVWNVLREHSTPRRRRAQSHRPRQRRSHTCDSRVVPEAALGALPQRLWKDRKSGCAGCQWHTVRRGVSYGLDGVDRHRTAVLSRGSRDSLALGTVTAQPRPPPRRWGPGAEHQCRVAGCWVYSHQGVAVQSEYVDWTTHTIDLLTNDSSPQGRQRAQVRRPRLKRLPPPCRLPHRLRRPSPHRRLQLPQQRTMARPGRRPGHFAHGCPGRLGQHQTGAARTGRCRSGV